MQRSKAYTPNEVAGFFAADSATDEYNYSTTREDIAMTFEEFMMVRNHRGGATWRSPTRSDRPPPARI